MTDLTRRLARLRVPLGFLFAALVLGLATPTGRSLAWGSGIAVCGEALRVWAAGHLNKSREVTASGPYRWLAHPLYVGSAVMGVGLAIAGGSVIVTMLIALYLGTTISAAIRSEERFLREKFGDQYEQYRRGRALAGRGGADAGTTIDSTRRFSLAQAVANREHRAIGGLALAVLLLALRAMVAR